MLALKPRPRAQLKSAPLRWPTSDFNLTNLSTAHHDDGEEDLDGNDDDDDDDGML